jgi:hypothetical protein
MEPSRSRWREVYRLHRFVELARDLLTSRHRRRGQSLRNLLVAEQGWVMVIDDTGPDRSRRIGSSVLASSSSVTH